LCPWELGEKHSATTNKECHSPSHIKLWVVSVAMRYYIDNNWYSEQWYTMIPLKFRDISTLKYDGHWWTSCLHSAKQFAFGRQQVLLVRKARCSRDDSPLVCCKHSTETLIQVLSFLNGFLLEIYEWNNSETRAYKSPFRRWCFSLRRLCVWCPANPFAASNFRPG
jgi:hypothetical protein